MPTHVTQTEDFVANQIPYATAGGNVDGEAAFTYDPTTDMLTVADLTLTGGDLVAATATTFNVFNTVATTVNAFGAATTLALGAANVVVNFAGGVTINGGTAANDDLVLQGTSNATRTTSHVALQPNGGNVGIGTVTFGSSMNGGLALKNGTAPSGNVTDVFQHYAADITAGNSAPHWRTENGDVIKLYKVATYTPTNVTTDRSWDSNATTLDEVSDVLATLVQDLQALGILG